MGQYHVLVNLDKKQYVHAHRIDNGLKLMEQVGFEKSTASALWLLMAASCKGGRRGGGDSRSEHPLIGAWAGDRVAVIGDYAAEGDIPGMGEADLSSLYGGKGLEDISAAVKAMLDAEFGGG